jgi:hypothetical protein
VPKGNAKGAGNTASAGNASKAKAAATDAALAALDRAQARRGAALAPASVNDRLLARLADRPAQAAHGNLVAAARRAGPANALSASAKAKAVAAAFATLNDSDSSSSLAQAPKLVSGRLLSRLARV